MITLIVRLVFPSSERLHRRPDPQNLSHEPGHPSYGDGVRAVRLHRPRPGNRINRQPDVAQREGKAATQRAGWCQSSFITACSMFTHVLPLRK